MKKLFYLIVLTALIPRGAMAIGGVGFNGVNDMAYVTPGMVDLLANSNSTFTVFAWAKPTNVVNQQQVWGITQASQDGGANISLFVRTNRALLFLRGSPAGAAYYSHPNATITANEWCLIAASRDAHNTWRLTVNGLSAGTHTHGMNNSSAVNNEQIGEWPGNSSTFFFGGVIGPVGAYTNGTLTDSQQFNMYWSWGDLPSWNTTADAKPRLIHYTDWLGLDTGQSTYEYFDELSYIYTDQYYNGTRRWRINEIGTPTTSMWYAVGLPLKTRRRR